MIRRSGSDCLDGAIEELATLLLASARYFPKPCWIYVESVFLLDRFTELSRLGTGAEWAMKA
jgi:hypothetical protein